MQRPWVLVENTLPDIEKLNPEVAVWPVGAIEPHGHHLTYGADFFQATYVAETAGGKAYEAGARVVVLPALPYGTNRQTFGFPFAINVDPSTQFTILKNIVESIEHSTAHKLVIINSHGGNDYKPMLRELAGQTKLFVCVINWWQMPDMLTLWSEVGDHADVMETSANMFINPEHVHMEQAADGTTTRPRFEALRTGYAKIGRMWHHLTASSGAGNPAGASPEAGRRFVEAAVERIARFLKELSDTPLDETFPFEPLS